MGKLGKRKRAREAAVFSEAVAASSDSRVDFAEAVRAANSLARSLPVWSSPALKSLRAALHPLLAFESNRGAHFEPRFTWVGEPAPDTSPEALAPLRVAADALSADLPAFAAPAARELRRALHPFVVAARGGDALHDSLVARATRAFRAKDWPRVLIFLRDIAVAGKPPRLGTLQRWVRDADLARDDDAGGGNVHPTVGGAGDGGGTGAEESDSDDGRAVEAAAARVASPSAAAAGGAANVSLLLLDAVLRTAKAGTDVAFGLATTATLVRHAPFCADAGAGAGTDAGDLPDAAHDEGFAARVVAASRVVSLVPGALRRPASPHDLRVWTTAAGTISLAPRIKDCVTRCDVTSVPGAFLLLNLLSHAECVRIIAAAEAIGYAVDAVPGIEALQLIANESLLSSVFSRAAPHLPARLGADTLASLNARWRLFRYAAGVDYRAHIDGAWPGSGLDERGRLVDDFFDGMRVSRLTFLVYLNSGFGGGTTTFFSPNVGAVGTVDAFAVKPIAGAALCFPHGDSASLVHEGSAVEGGGVKYVVRTDVLYRREVQ
jgi:hypothetical protein